MKFLAPLLFLVACADTTPPEADATAVASALEEDNGGFDTADEALQFGTPELFASAAIESDAAVTDALATDPTIVDLQATAEAHTVLVAWGQLPADPLATDARDWSGELRLSRGALVVDRTIAFEDATDRLLPRQRRDAVAFASRTRPFVDGLVLTVLDPTPAAAEPLTLTYTAATGGATYTLDLSQLAAGPIVVDAGDNNRIVATGVRRDPDPCRSGVMRGRWHQLTPHLGTFLGGVADKDGTPIGNVRGIYGERRDGAHVWFGKFIDRDGRFIGIMGGDFRDNHFAGRWADRAGDRGAIHGVYFEGPTLRAGAWAARWAETTCDR
jgi:hypothetical protein